MGQPLRPVPPRRLPALVAPSKTEPGHLSMAEIQRVADRMLKIRGDLRAIAASIGIRFITRPDIGTGPHCHGNKIILPMQHTAWDRAVGFATVLFKQAEEGREPRIEWNWTDVDELAGRLMAAEQADYEAPETTGEYLLAVLRPEQLPSSS